MTDCLGSGNKVFQKYLQLTLRKLPERNQRKLVSQIFSYNGAKLAIIVMDG